MSREYYTENLSDVNHNSRPSRWTPGEPAPKDARPDAREALRRNALFHAQQQERTHIAPPRRTHYAPDRRAA